MSKIALTAIAKNEDNYLKEWVDYHLKIGFDNITIYQNNWRYRKNDITDNRVKFIECDGQKMQPIAYQDFIEKNCNEYDFGCFWDIDEFIKIKETDIHETLSSFKNIFVIGVPRVQFGSNGYTEVIDNNYSVLKRFTRCQKGYETLIKPIVNFKLCGNNVMIPNPHIATFKNIQPIGAVDPSKKLESHNGNFFNINETGIQEPFQLNHYVLKTLHERLERRHSGDAFWGDEWRNRETDQNITETFNKNNSFMNDILDESLKEVL